MLEQILRYLKNYFIVEVWTGTFVIESGSIDVDFLKEGQYFRICGSIFNDGVYRYPAEDLKDEVFDGEVWALAVPNEIISISEEAEVVYQKNKDVFDSPFNSESFGGYSYTKGGNSSGASGRAAAIRGFADQLDSWRKIRYEFVIRRNDYLHNS